MFNQIKKLDIVFKSQRGKVRDIFDLGETLLIVTSDRVSAFDVVFPQTLTGKGAILNQIAVHAFKLTAPLVPNHFITDDVDAYPHALKRFKPYLEGRSMLVKKLKIIPFECIVRGYLSGSAWAEYKVSKSVGGLPLPPKMRESEAFPEPIFTPSTKADQGHDENITFLQMRESMDPALADLARDYSLKLYTWAHAKLKEKGIILADTKFEFGLLDGELLLGDEALTPDSSRFWDSSQYSLGKTPASFDKQIIRDHLTRIGWNKKPPAPLLPPHIIQKTMDRYQQIRDIILGGID
ncbi:MAG: phosphoribosylaminoimidazolesuccinocarboxamide synthase [Desulfobulbus sp.]|jgi:phosphoribosylaminoimidazole-succinocarboxamide synthase|nr:phosphoribosylaminoimidazolesuccinocarboxamide synthase [Desulfobulbus sp.]NLN85214.1 phosphoribosylaminoimidazolesuccinocarboxamide synthase [Candidatus Cloacimonadota bacterium]